MAEISEEVKEKETKLEIEPLTFERTKCDCPPDDCIPMCNNGRVCCLTNIFVQDLMF